MKKLSLVFLLWSLTLVLFVEVRANQAKIVSGAIFFGGTSYGTPDYQTFLRFTLDAKNRAPYRNLQLDAVQPYSVYLNHPVQPNGNFEFSVVMPYGPQSLKINNVPFYPVWYGDSKWTIYSTAQTPEATAASPQFVTVNTPFRMAGSSAIIGANTSYFKVKGDGNANIVFEKIRDKYYFLEANYVFTEPSLLEKDTK